MLCRRTDCLSEPLSGLFERLGSLVGSRPLFFFIIPLMLTAVLGGGFVFLSDREDNDFEKQFTPKKGPSKVARAFVDENFPYNGSMFSVERLSNLEYYATLLALSTDSSNILENPCFEDVIRLNEKILNITVSDGNETVGFKDLCAKAYGECVSNVILEIIQSNETQISFPTYNNRSTSVFLGSVLGGVITDANSSVVSAQAVKLFYYLDDLESKADASKLWLRAFKKLLSHEKAADRHIDVSYFTSKSRQEEIASHATDGFPLFLIAYASAITFSVISCLRRDNVRNKVWVVFFGVLTAGLAVVSAFGFLLYIGMPFVITVAISPFLILGIGLNNTFVILADWQHTKVNDPVPKRMAHTYKEAIMPITITALTDVIKFSVGVTADFPSVQSFCLYTAISIIFCYIYTITFFGAFLALNGRREASNRHWLTCMKIPSDNLDHHTKIQNICCVGGYYDNDTGAEKKQLVSNFFKDYYGPFLIKPWVKGAVIFLYAVYLATSIYGCFYVKQGIEMYDLAADVSHVTRFSRKDREYFSDYGPSVMVIVSGEFPYWDQIMRQQLQLCMQNFKELNCVDHDIYTSWLDSYLSYGEEAQLNLNDKDVFLQNLTQFFDVNPFFKQDVNLTGDTIFASRVFIQTIDIDDASMEVQMLSELKTAAGRCRIAPLLYYNWEFIFLDQYAVVISSTIKNVCVITAAMLVVSLLLIPSPFCSIWVAGSIASVTVGVTGAMVLWNITLDSITMIIYTVCIGFTVDFSAHVTYGFASSKKPSQEEKAVEALSHLGYPIIQGAMSTIFGVSVLAISEFHTFRMFFKIFFLVIVVGMVHGLIFIPVILMLFTSRTEKPGLKITKL